MPKLGDAIRRSQRVESAPMGFGAARAAAKPSMLVGFQGAASDAAAAKEAGADFLIIDGNVNAAAVKDLRAAAGDLPLGALPKAIEADKTEELRKAGLDFLAFDVEKTPAAAILDEDTGYVLLLPQEKDELKRDLLLRSLEPLTLEAVLLPAFSGGLTVAQQLDLVRVAMLTHKPLISPADASASSEDLQCLRAAGVVALVAAKADAVSALKTAVAALPARKQRRDDRPVVSLPRGNQPAEDDDEE